jgi:hypothetical protein
MVRLEEADGRVEDPGFAELPKILLIILLEVEKEGRPEGDILFLELVFRLKVTGPETLRNNLLNI